MKAPPIEKKRNPVVPEHDENAAQKKKKDERASDKNISYEILKNVTGGKGKMMDILVNDAASKEDVLMLAKSLQQQHGGNLSLISIFDSRGAWQQFEGGKKLYSEPELERHWLCDVEPNRIWWLAKGRDH